MKKRTKMPSNFMTGSWTKKQRQAAWNLGLRKVNGKYVRIKKKKKK